MSVFKSIILALLVNFSITMNANILTINNFYNDLQYLPNQNIVVYLICAFKVLQQFSANSIYLVILLFLFFLFLSMKKIKISRYAKGYGLIAAFLSLIGITYTNFDSWDFIFATKTNFLFSIIFIIGYYFLYSRLTQFIFLGFDYWKKYQKISRPVSIPALIKKLGHIFDTYPFLCSMLFIALIWLPIIVIFYPGGISNDTVDQLVSYQALKGIAHGTNHYPWLTSLLYGILFNIGARISDNFGLFIANLFQIVINILCLAYSISFLKSKNISLKMRCLVLFLYSFLSIFIVSSYTLDKDSLMMPVHMIFTLEIYEILIGNSVKKNLSFHYLLLILSMIFMIALRQNGFYVVLLTLIVLFLYYYKKNRASRITVSALIIGSFACYLFFYNISLSIFDIEKSNIRESLSIPMQQTARYLREYPEAITPDELQALSEITDPAILANAYYPYCSDDVKSLFNITSSEQLKDYLSVWRKQLFRHPDSYVQSFINGTFQYYSLYSGIERNERATIIIDKNHPKSEQFNFYLNSPLSQYSDTFKILFYAIIDSPIGIFWHPAFHFHLSLILALYCIIKKKHQLLLMFLPNLVTWMVCLASPVNGCVRYALPFICTSHLLFLLILQEISPDSEGV